MKANKRNISILIGVLFIAAAAIMYVYYFLPNQNNTLAVQAEITSLKSRLMVLEQYKSMKPQYNDEMAKMEEEDKEIINHLPIDIRPEDEIVLATTLENWAGMAISNITYGNPASVATISEEKIAYKIPMSISYTTTYDGLKSAARFLNDKTDRAAIDSISVGFDTGTGNLSGTMIINLYYLTGTGKEYMAPLLPYIPVGSDNIFNTIEH